MCCSVVLSYGLLYRPFCKSSCISGRGGSRDRRSDLLPVTSRDEGKRDEDPGARKSSRRFAKSASADSANRPAPSATRPSIREVVSRRHALLRERDTVANHFLYDTLGPSEA